MPSRASRPGGGDGGGVYNVSNPAPPFGSFRVANTIFADNKVRTSTANPSKEYFGSVASYGYNLRTTVDPTCTFGSSTDVVNPSPLIGPLTDNGRPTPTIALLPGSPAINAGYTFVQIPVVGPCPDTDQRGLPRSGLAGPCDIGAFEVQPELKAVATGGAPSNAFTIGKLKGRKLTLRVSSAGRAEVTDAGARSIAMGALAARKKLKHSSATGGPGRIELTLKLTGAAKQKLRRKGKTRVKAQITVTPNGGIPNSKTAKLKIRVDGIASDVEELARSLTRINQQKEVPHA